MDRSNLILQLNIRKGKRKIVPYKRGGAEVARNLMLDRLQIACTWVWCYSEGGLLFLINESKKASTFVYHAEFM